MATFPCVVWEGVPSCCSGAFLFPVMGSRPSNKDQAIWLEHLCGRPQGLLPSYALLGCLASMMNAVHHISVGILPQVLSSASSSDLAGRVGKKEMGCWWTVSYSWLYSNKAKVKTELKTPSSKNHNKTIEDILQA